MTRRIIAAALLLVLLLSGCGWKAAPPRVFQNTAPNRAEAAAECVLALRSGAPEELKTAAREFRDRAAELSGGLLLVTVLETADPAGELSGGRAHLALLSDREASAFSGLFSVFSVPFLYRSYLHFTMAANSEAVLDILADDMDANSGMIPLAGFYGGASRLLTSLVIEDPFRASPRPDEGPLRAVLPQGSPLAGGLALLGLELRTEDDPALRYRLLEQDEAQLAEFSPDEMSASYEWLNGSYYYVDAMGGVRSDWLLADGAFFDSLDKKSRAAVQEVIAYLFALVDEVYLRRESMAQVSMREQETPQLAPPEAFRQASAAEWRDRQEQSAVRDHLLEQITAIGG